MPEAQTPPRRWRKDYRPYPYEIRSVQLRFELAESSTVVHSRLEVVRKPEVSADEPLALDGEQLRTERFRVDGEDRDPAGMARDDEGRLLVSELGPEAVIEATVRVDPAANRALEGLYLSNGIYCTQCEAEGFRRITWYPDRPDVMSRFEVTIVGDPSQTPVMLSNGNRVAQEDLSDGRRLVRWEDPYKKPSYLFALVAGDLACESGTFRTRSGREVALEIWVEPRHSAQCAHALTSLRKAMLWDEESFDLEYDLDTYMIVAVSDFNMGAMENKGLNIFNSKYVLASAETATDDDYENIEGVIAHEYFHNWTGNRVTCRDWFQLTLKEGLTVYRDQRFTADMTSAPVKRIDDVRALRSAQFPEDAGPMSHPIRPESYVEMNNFYTATVYEKGAEVVRLYATVLGEEGFKKGLDLYFERHDGEAVTCDDFRRAMGDANVRDLDSFERWYEQAGTPRLQLNEEWHPDRSEISLTFEQWNPGAPNAEPLPIPVRTALIDQQGRNLPIDAEGSTEKVLLLTERKQTFDLPCAVERPLVSVLRDFSAPVRLEVERDLADLALRMRRETDPFNRWDAGQELGTRVILDAAKAIQAGEAVEIPAGFCEAFQSVLTAQKLDGSLKAQALALPNLRVLTQRVDVVHIHALHAARVAVRQQLAERLASDWEEWLERTEPQGPYRSERAEVHRRRLHGTCQAYLARRSEPDFTSVLYEKFRAADNMTDTQTALSLLADVDGEPARRALEEFEARHRDDPLVMDKWFSVQAAATHDGAMDNVEALRRHPDFTLDNPNRVRALIAVFAYANLPTFHRRDGRGYRLLEEVVNELDGRNPQVAARLVSAFNDYRRYEPELRNSMKATIERISQRPGLSKDVYEIVSRALSA